jgi:hypothetical protein
MRDIDIDRTSGKEINNASRRTTNPEAKEMGV